MNRSCDDDIVVSHSDNDDSNNELLSMNTLSYRTLLDKEEMEDCAVDTIPMDDLVVYKNTDKKVNTKVLLQFKVRLLQAKKQTLSGCKVLVNLLRYVI